jgi:chorismate--pyruvate lyase
MTAMIPAGRSASATRPASTPAAPAAGEWLPAERLGQFEIDAPLRPWLIGKGLLTERLRQACGARFALRLVHQWTGLLDGPLRARLGIADAAGLFREVELCCGEAPWVYAQTVVPDSTLTLYPWLAELGEASLGETLSGLTGIERSAYEYACLPAREALGSRVPRDEEASGVLWARRSRIKVRGAPLLVQEVFLPSIVRPTP